MTLKPFFILLTCLLSLSSLAQTDTTKLTVILSGSDIDEGKYKQTAFFDFYAYHEKCMLMKKTNKAKLNRTTRTETLYHQPDKPVILFFYYSDQRTQYGRGGGKYMSFNPVKGKDYTIELKVEKGSVKIYAFEETRQSQEKKEIPIKIGIEHIDCK